MSRFRTHSSDEIAEMEVDGELWVCLTCDHHTHVDNVGNTCPACGADAGDDA